jgi:metallo-beta-lactamase family protein
MEAGGSLTPILAFLGATETVTGSRFLVETAAARVLVDCGLYQGVKELRLRNWEPFPVEPASLDAVVLTHAHVDHCGYVPALARLGFERPVYATPDTVSLAGIVLPDSGHLMEEEAAYANRRGYSKHTPARPLYTKAEAEASLQLFEGIPFGETRQVAEGVSVTLRPTGHILGAASVMLALGPAGRERRVLLSGDLGRAEHPLLVPPAPVGDVDVVVMESTYGDRLHDDAGALEDLAAAIRRTAARGGTVVIPAFAVDRTEVVLFRLRELLADGRIPELPVFVDSPMALAALQVYRRALTAGSPDVRDGVRTGTAGDVLGLRDVREARDVERSKEIDRHDFPSIVISASGMATGGRVLHHLSCRLPDPHNTVVLVGFQAVQTRGRLLAEGAREIKMLGRYVPVRAEIVTLPSFSVHADRDELVAWLGTAAPPPEHVYLVHGEADASASLAQAVHDRLGRDVTVPKLGERVRLD